MVNEARRGRRALALPLAIVVVSFAIAGATFAQAPGEVTNVQLGSGGDLTWSTVPGADHYNVYRSRLAPAREELSCHTYALPGTSLAADDPAPGEILAFAVTGESVAAGEGTAGVATDGLPRYLQGACAPLMTKHLLTRGGYGWSQWANDRIATLGSLQAYMDEQFEPATIDESSNFVMNNKLASWDPPEDAVGLIARDVIYAVYARRQLEHRMGMFWVNHFHTHWLKVAERFRDFFPDCTTSPSDPGCDGTFPLRSERTAAVIQQNDFETFRTLGLAGNFRQILEAGSLSAAMLIYLDLETSEALNPNENQPRELLELHSMGEGNGYTQGDVEEVTRLLTGWGVCKKETADLGDPLAPCLASYWLLTPPGEWTANFDISRHDCGPKTLFAGTAHEITFPGTPTCSTGADAAAAMVEFDQMLDAVAAHPSTARFISGKILELLVTDSPPTTMVDQLVAVWNDPTNPTGVGDLKEVTREALSLLTPLNAGSKIKTPLEQFASSLRILKGNTDGATEILVALTKAKHLPFFFEIPTGYSETGGDWLSTGGTLVRQNWGIDLATAFPSTTFSASVVPLLIQNGISTAPGNTEEIIDFFTDILFGGDLTPFERQEAIKYLNTNDDRLPEDYDDDRIREAVAMMLGYPQFAEQ